MSDETVETDRLRNLRRNLGILVIATMVALQALGAQDARPPVASIRPQKSASQPLVPAANPDSRQLTTSRATPASFTRDMPLGEAIDILRNSTKPPLNIIVYWKNLRDSAEIYRDTPIGFDGVRGLRLRQSLEILLTSLSATSPARIDYTLDHGVIVIATTDALPRPRRTTRIYDISDLAAAPARWSFSPMLYTIMSNNMGQSRRLGASPSNTLRSSTPRR